MDGVVLLLTFGEKRGALEGGGDDQSVDAGCDRGLGPASSAGPRGGTGYGVTCGASGRDIAGPSPQPPASSAGQASPSGRGGRRGDRGLGPASPVQARGRQARGIGGGEGMIRVWWRVAIAGWAPHQVRGIGRGSARGIGRGSARGIGRGRGGRRGSGIWRCGRALV